MKNILFCFFIALVSYSSFGQCTETTTLTSNSGTFDDGSGSSNYSNNQDCSWLITPENSSTITLEFTSFHLENCCDVVKVYDGNSSAAPLIASYQGSTIPTDITSSGPSLYITFTSDNTATFPGFEASYSACSNTTSSFEITADGNTELCAVTSPPTLTSPISPVTWSTGEMTDEISIDNAGNYSAIAYSQGCIIYSDTITFTDNSPLAYIDYETSEVCSGGEIDLRAIVTNKLFDNFSTEKTDIWSVNTGTYTSGCQSSDRLYFEGSGTRQLATESLDLRDGAVISFNIEQGTCEPLSPGKEIQIQISLNEGASWYRLAELVFANYTSPTNLYYTLSPNASYESARIRWIQMDHDNASNDTWSLDSVSVIYTAASKYMDIFWSPSEIMNDATSSSTFATIQDSTTITLKVSDPNTGCFKSTSIAVDTVDDYFNLSISNDSITGCVDAFTFLSVFTNKSEDLDFQWNSNGDFVNSNTGYTSGNITESQTVTLTLTDTVVGCVDSVQTQITVLPTPQKPTVSIDGSLCENDTIYLIGLEEYDWSTGDYDDTIPVTSSGIYRAISYSSEGCPSYSDYIPITDPSPVTTISLGNDGNVCSGGQIELGASPQNTTSNDLMYTWSPASAVENPNSQTTLSNKLYYQEDFKLTVEDLQTGCEYTTSKTVYLASTSSIPTPVISTSQSSVCTGGQVTLSTNSVGEGVSDDFYSSNTSSIWSTNTGTYTRYCTFEPLGALYFHSDGQRQLASYDLDFSDGATITYDIELGGCDQVESGEDVFLQISSNSGFSWTTLRTNYYYLSSESTITHTIPAGLYSNARIRWIQMSNSGSGFDTWYLDDVTINLNATSTDQYDYSWSPANSFVSGIDSTLATTDAITSSTSYSLTITNTLSKCSSTSSKNVYILPQSLSVSTSSNPAYSVCQGQNLTLGATVGSSSDYSKYSFEWSPSGNMDNDTLYNPTVSNVSNSGYYYVTVTDKETNCTGTSSRYISTSSSTAVKPTITEVDGYLVCNEYSSGLKWYYGDVQITGEYIKYLNLANNNYANGCYKVEASSGSCNPISDCHNYPEVTGLESINSSLLSLYPNPAFNQIKIELPFTLSNPKVSILSMDGTEITSLISISDFEDGDAQIDISGLNAGMYLLKVNSDEIELLKYFTKSF